jgi:hypothetical protein
MSFQKQVIASFKGGLKRAEKKVELFKKLQKAARAEQNHKAVAELELAVRHHENEVAMYKKLIGRARSKPSIYG